MQGKRNKWIFWLALLLILIGIILLAIVLVSSNPLEKMTINAKVTLGDHNGFDLNKSTLSFGNITVGNYATRNMSVENNYDFPVMFFFDVKGNISQFLIYPEVVYLEIGERENISFIAIFPENKTGGDYFGEITARVRKVD